MHTNTSLRALCGGAALALPLLLLGCSGCSGGGGGERAGLILAQAHFPDSKPGPSRMLLVRPAGEGEPWSVESVEADDGSNVFQKALWFEPASGDPGILTISANPAWLKLWHDSASGWTDEELWTEKVGDKQQRLRDVEVGDVTGDGVDDLVIVTHDLGAVYVIEQKGGKYVPTEIARTTEHTFIHEVELGDVDGDGKLEIFTTPSEPNNLKGEEQGGFIKMYHRDASGGFVESVVEQFDTRHVKEILCCDFEGTGKPVLFASIEGENIDLANPDAPGATTMLREYRWQDGEMVGEKVLDLPGKLCRFLVMGDTDGDGRPEIVAATRQDGIHAIYREGGAWTKRTIARGNRTSSFEHATIVMDWDGDGADDVFVASDDQKKVQRFWFDAQADRYKGEELAEIPGGRAFTFNMMPLPPGK